jgi:hypothetical protein
MPDRLTLNPDH